MLPRIAGLIVAALALLPFPVTILLFRLSPQRLIMKGQQRGFVRRWSEVSV